MILDFNPANGAYILRLPRKEGDPQTFMREYGLDFSLSGSTSTEAMLFTKDHYAAASFYNVATPAARARLGYIADQIEKSWAPTSDCNIDIPPDKELWPFQRASVDYLMQVEHGLDADQPGLGKTPTAIAVANEMKAQRVLVVCPASIRHQWCRRIREWSTMNITYPADNDNIVYAITSSSGGVHPHAAWTVISYELCRTPGLWKALAKGEYDLLILDEAHYAKTVDAKRTRSIFGGGHDLPAEPLMARAKKVIALSGTPLPNRPREAYVLARHLCWEAIDWLSEDAFNERFNPYRRSRTSGGKVWVEEHQGRLPELQNRMRGNFMVRHLKRDVMPQLHYPEFDLIRLEETEPVKAALQAESLLDIDPEMLEVTPLSPDQIGQVSSVRKQMGVALAPQVAEYLITLVDLVGEEKLVVFAWHIEVLDILCRAIQEWYAKKYGKRAAEPYGVVRVDGKDSAASKDRKVQQFIQDPAVHFIVGNVLSLGTGTDGLQQVATHCLLAEPDWVYGNNEQCVDRLNRGGQTGQVQADFFVAPGSISEKVLASALRKGGVVHKALDRRAA